MVRVRTWTGPGLDHRSGPKAVQQASGPGPGKGQKSGNGPVHGPGKMPWTGPGPDFGNYSWRRHADRHAQLNILCKPNSLYYVENAEELASFQYITPVR